MSTAGDYEGMESIYTDDLVWIQLDDLLRDLEAANEGTAREPFTENDCTVPQIESSEADDSKLLFNSPELDDEEVEIEDIFDLEQASLSDTSSFSSVDIGDGAILGFVPIVGRKEDPYTEWLNKAIKGENDSGGVGPFVFPHSPYVFMGGAEKAGEKLVKFKPLPPMPLTPPTLPRKINKQSLNRAGGPRSQMVRAMPPAPPTYAGQQPNVAYNNPQLNVAYNNFQPSLAYGPQMPVAHDAQGQNWAYGPHNQNAWVIPYGPQMYTHGQPNLVHESQPNVVYGPQFQNVQPVVAQPPPYTQGHQNLVYDPQTQTYRYVTYV